MAQRARDLRALQRAPRRAGVLGPGLLRRFRVAVVCTTDDPVDSLAEHAALAARVDPETRVVPTFRPDRVLATGDPRAWNAWVDRLSEAAAVSIGSFSSLLAALESRHAFFHAAGCRASDHGLERIDADPWTDEDAEKAFARLRSGQALDAGEAGGFRSVLLHRLALLDHARGWVQQFHLGALRTTTHACAARLAPTAASTRSEISPRRSLWRAFSTGWTARTGSPRPSCTT